MGQTKRVSKSFTLDRWHHFTFAEQCGSSA